jgi:hypothetical protein
LLPCRSPLLSHFLKGRQGIVGLWRVLFPVLQLPTSLSNGLYRLPEIIELLEHTEEVFTEIGDLILVIIPPRRLNASLNLVSVPPNPLIEVTQIVFGPDDPRRLLLKFPSYCLNALGGLIEILILVLHVDSVFMQDPERPDGG